MMYMCGSVFFFSPKIFPCGNNKKKSPMKCTKGLFEKRKKKKRS